MTTFETAFGRNPEAPATTLQYPVSVRHDPSSQQRDSQ
jgi:hypothetical protein